MKKSFLVILSFVFIVFVSSCRNNANSTTDVIEDSENLEMEMGTEQEEIVSTETNNNSQLVEQEVVEEVSTENLNEEGLPIGEEEKKEVPQE